MESVLPLMILLLTLFFVVTQGVMLYLISKSINSHKKDHLIDQDVTNQLKDRTEKVMEEAVRHANEVMSDANKKGIEILAREELTGKSLASEYGKHLLAVQDALKAQFERSIMQAESAYNDFIVQTGHAVNTQIDKNEQLLTKQAQDLIVQTKDRLDQMTDDTQKAVKGEIENQLSSVRTEIDEYKLRRMKMIDERIIAMLEDVIKVTLEKKLSLQEQSELVYRALEEAKKENAFK